jgi:hypothetical protein
MLKLKYVKFTGARQILQHLNRLCRLVGKGKGGVSAGICKSYWVWFRVCRIARLRRAEYSGAFLAQDVVRC